MEDLHGCYSPPKLDPVHEERLKMLKLAFVMRGLKTEEVIDVQLLLTTGVYVNGDI